MLMDLDAPPVASRLDPAHPAHAGRVTDDAPPAAPPLHPSPPPPLAAAAAAAVRVQDEPDPIMVASHKSPARLDATMALDAPLSAPIRDDHDTDGPVPRQPDANDTQTAAMTTTSTVPPLDTDMRDSPWPHSPPIPNQPDFPFPASAHHSQDTTISSSTATTTTTTTTNRDADRVFTPTVSEGGLSNGAADARHSSQDSQLMQFSSLAAAQEKMPESAPSKKRMANGMAKSAVGGGERNSASPVFPSVSSHHQQQQHHHHHSRNASTVSVASTSGTSRIGELSTELKARLSYAMVKVSHGWHAHSIDQVENLASQSASPPSSSHSTVYLHHASSASPPLPAASRLATAHAHPAAPTAAAAGLASTSRPSSLPEPPQQPRHEQRRSPSPQRTLRPAPTLAPPVSIQPSPSFHNPRRTSVSRPAPSLITHSHSSSSSNNSNNTNTNNNNASPSTAPHTPGQASPYPSSAPPQRTPLVDPVLFSPHQTPYQAVREQDAMEALLFMSSPGNSANLKHAFPPVASPNPSQATTTTTATATAAASLTAASRTTTAQRTLLPNSQPAPRKSLPNSRPHHHNGGGNSNSSHIHQTLQSPSSQPTPRRVGFGGRDDPLQPPPGTPQTTRGTPGRRKLPHAAPQPPPVEPLSPPPRLRQIPLSAGLVAPSRRPRPAPLAEEDIDRMLDRVAAEESSDSEGEIQIPVRGAAHREEAHAVGA